MADAHDSKSCEATHESSSLSSGTIMQKQHYKHIVILGGGFGGIYAFHTLHKRYHGDPSVKITIVNRTDYFLFTPLLHEVATGGVSRDSVMFNIRSFFDGCSAELVEAEARHIDFDKKIIATSAGDYHYDIVVYGLGAGTHFFNLSPEARARVLPLKTIEDAAAIKARLKNVFEDHHAPSIIVVGGGPTGVEVVVEALEFADTVKKSLKGDGDRRGHFYLVDAGTGLLPQFHATLGKQAKHILEERGIDVITRESVVDVHEHEAVCASGRRIPAHMVIWTAGVRARLIPCAPPPAVDEKGRIVVASTLQVQGHADAFAVGDAAAITCGGGVVPMAAQAAVQEGTVAGRNIIALLNGEPLEQFQYRHRGDLFSLGQWLAGAEIFGMRFFGHTAWFLWRTIYLSKIIGLRNKVRVMVEWTLNIFLPRDING